MQVKDRRGRIGASVIGMRGRRGVSVIGLRGKIDARDKRGMREGKGMSERIGVRGSEEVEEFLSDRGDCVGVHMAYYWKRAKKS